MVNYFNTLTFLQKLAHLRKCRFVRRDEFIGVLDYLKSKRVAIIGCGSQGLNQGLNMRDSGINDITYVLRNQALLECSESYKRAVAHNFKVGTYEEIIPESDVIINLTPDKFHSSVIQQIQGLMKYGAYLGYSHGFNIVEVGEKIRQDITVVMVAPKCPGTEVREEYCRGFGVPSLIAVHSENDPKGEGMMLAMSWAAAIGSHRAGVLETSFVAEVKSDLMGEQTILCGMLQVVSCVCFDKMVSDGIDSIYAAKLIQYGWSVITEALKHGGITLMMDRLSNSAKIRAFDLSEKLKILLRPLFEKHMNDIISGSFSKNMMLDWRNGDTQLFQWRNKTSMSPFEKAADVCHVYIDEQVYFDHGVFMIATIRAGVELAYEVMIECGISKELAYYESLHELPLIANTISRKRLHEMNLVISDTAEYGSYLFSDSAASLLNNFILKLKKGDIGTSVQSVNINNIHLKNINEIIRKHPIEKVGVFLRNYMRDMKEIEIV